jgi:hypothetical protein
MVVPIGSSAWAILLGGQSKPAHETMSEEKLSSFLKTGSDWSRIKTSVPGIFILKMPAYKGIPARLAVELNPPDHVGSPTKKRGLVLRTKAELEEFRLLFQFEKLTPLLESVDKVNPQTRLSSSRPSEDIIEI